MTTSAYAASGDHAAALRAGDSGLHSLEAGTSMLSNCGGCRPSAATASIPGAALAAASDAISGQPTGSSAAHLARVVVEAAVPIIRQHEARQSRATAWQDKPKERNSKVNHEVQVDWREPTDEEIELIEVHGGDRCEEDGLWFLVCWDRCQGGVIVGGNADLALTSSAWSTTSDKDLRAAWWELTGRQLGPRGDRSAAGARDAPDGCWTGARGTSSPRRPQER